MHIRLSNIVENKTFLTNTCIHVTILVVFCKAVFYIVTSQHNYHVYDIYKMQSRIDNPETKREGGREGVSEWVSEWVSVA